LDASASRQGEREEGKKARKSFRVYFCPAARGKERKGGGAGKFCPYTSGLICVEMAGNNESLLVEPRPSPARKKREKGKRKKGGSCEPDSPGEDIPWRTGGEKKKGGGGGGKVRMTVVMRHDGRRGIDQEGAEEKEKGGRTPRADVNWGTESQRRIYLAYSSLARKKKKKGGRRRSSSRGKKATFVACTRRRRDERRKTIR